MERRNKKKEEEEDMMHACMPIAKSLGKAATHVDSGGGRTCYKPRSVFWFKLRAFKNGLATVVEIPKNMMPIDRNF